MAKDDRELYSTDQMMTLLYHHLINDFSPHIPSLLRHRARLAVKDPKVFRALDWPNAEACTSAYYRRQRQLEMFFKRYVFMNDVYDEAALQKKGYGDFVAAQKGFGFDSSALSNTTQLVLDRARKIVQGILGPFDWDKASEFLKPGKKSAVGLPRREAYLHNRFKRLGGTLAQQEMWKRVCGSDPHLEELSTSWSSVVELQLTVVPKSWKSMRTIAADTVAGGFLSLAVGGLIRDRLEASTHIDLARAKDTHQSLARSASRNGHLVTADLSKASDSFTEQHILLLVPQDWKEALDVCRTANIKVPGFGTISPSTYMLMGCGYTFPLQTVLFYSLLSAIAGLMDSSGKRCWVFGDDLIYPTRLHPVVVKVLRELGFTLNKDKTYADGHFRESCGGDYFRGHDVRPYMPEMVGSLLPKHGYVSFCYKVLNGLLEKWDWWEIDASVNYLLDEIERVAGKILQVPPTCADGSGLKQFIPIGVRKVSPLVFTDDTVRFKQLKWVYSDEKVGENDQLCYLWDNLRTAREDHRFALCNGDIVQNTRQRRRTELEDLWYSEAPPEKLRWTGEGGCVPSRSKRVLKLQNHSVYISEWPDARWYTEHPARTITRIGEFAAVGLRCVQVEAPLGAPTARMPVHC